MTYYETYKFISPERVYTKVQEELRSYFSTGAVDTVLFPLWTEECIKEFRRTFLPIRQAYVCVENGIVELPEDFSSVREAWITSTHYSNPFIITGSKYYAEDYSIITVRELEPYDGYGVNINVDTHQIVKKETKQQVYSYSCVHRLSKGHVHKCDGSAIYEETEDGLKVGFTKGGLHLVYYSDGIAEDGDQLIPDDHKFILYLEKYLIFKIFTQVYNQTTDETFNQISQKRAEAKQEMYEALVSCQTESRSDSTEKKVRRVKKAQSRLDRYRL